MTENRASRALTSAQANTGASRPSTIRAVSCASAFATAPRIGAVSRGTIPEAAVAIYRLRLLRGSPREALAYLVDKLLPPREILAPNGCRVLFGQLAIGSAPACLIEFEHSRR